MQSTSSTFQQRTSSSTCKMRLDMQDKSKSKDNPSANFYRTSSKTNQISPSHSSNNNTLSRHKLTTQPTSHQQKLYRNDYFYPNDSQKIHKTHIQTINKLKEQNLLLKQQIAELKVTQFYQFDDQKLKRMLLELQQLKYEMKKIKELNQSLQLQNDFLNRTNWQLKKQLGNKVKNDTFTSLQAEFKMAKKQNQDEQTISATTAFIGKRASKFDQQPKTSKKNRNLGEVRSAKALTYFPELEINTHKLKGQATQRKNRVDGAAMGMKYKKKRGTAISEPQNQPGLTDRQ